MVGSRRNDTIRRGFAAAGGVAAAALVVGLVGCRSNSAQTVETSPTDSSASPPGTASNAADDNTALPGPVGTNAVPATTATPAPPADAGPETFDGTIDIEPASRTIALNAGDALKVRVVGSEAATDDFAIGIAPAGDVVDQWATYGYFSDDDYFENSEFYSDFRGDDGWMQYAYEYGPVIQFTQYQSPNDYFSDDSLYDSPPEFFVGGRGWGSAENGSWVMFVAPTTGSYNVILTGHGPFQVTLDTQPTAVVPEGAPEATNPFDASAPQDPVPFDSQLWADVIRSHLDWFFDGGTFGPAESYYSDYFSDDQYTPGEDEVYGPTPELRAEIEALLGSAMG